MRHKSPEHEHTWELVEDRIVINYEHILLEVKQVEHL